MGEKDITVYSLFCKRFHEIFVGKTVWDISEATGIDVSIVRDIYDGVAIPGAKNLILISMATGFSVDWLLGLSEKRHIYEIKTASEEEEKKPRKIPKGYIEVTSSYFDDAPCLIRARDITDVIPVKNHTKIFREYDIAVDEYSVVSETYDDVVRKMAEALE